MEAAFLQNKKINGFQLKILACTAMFLDHLAVCLMDSGVAGFAYMAGEAAPLPYQLLRIAGRLAFPIFCFLLVEGFYHTRSVIKYTLRLLAAAVISEFLFDYLLFGNLSALYMTTQNVLFTLAAGLLTLFGLNLAARKFTGNAMMYNLCGIVIILAACAATWYTKTDYGPVGIMLIVGFYFFRGKNVRIAVYFILVTLLTGTVMQYFSILALPFLLLYNGERGKRKAKYFFYIFFPAHLAALCLLRYFLIR